MERGSWVIRRGKEEYTWNRGLPLPIDPDGIYRWWEEGRDKFPTGRTIKFVENIKKKNIYI